LYTVFPFIIIVISIFIFFILFNICWFFIMSKKSRQFFPELHVPLYFESSFLSLSVSLFVTLSFFPCFFLSLLLSSPFFLFPFSFYFSLLVFFLSFYVFLYLFYGIVCLFSLAILHSFFFYLLHIICVQVTFKCKSNRLNMLGIYGYRMTGRILFIFWNTKSKLNNWRNYMSY
jgi:hypothetical protein